MKAVLLVSFLLMMLPLRQAEAAENYVVLPRGKACSLRIADVRIQSYRLLIPRDQVKRLANTSVVVNIDVCECFLLGGNPQTCAFNEMMKIASPQRLTKQQLDVLEGRIFLFIENKDEFSALFAALQPSSTTEAVDLAMRLIQSGGAGAPPPPSPPAPPVNPPTAGTQGQSGGNRDNEKPLCEIEPSVCIKPDGTAAEFEIKCRGFPPIIVTTDGKAGLKLGPLEVSITKH